MRQFVNPKNDKQMIIDLQDIVIADTNSSLISIEINQLCAKFVNDLKLIPLSEELQSSKTEKWEKITLGELSEEINTMLRLNEKGHPKELYVRCKQALEQLKAFLKQ